MSQHDLDLANQVGSDFRADLNLALKALGSINSGTAAPGTTYAYQHWADTVNGIVKQRNAANSGWVNRAPLAETLVVDRASNTILGVGDYGRLIRATAGFTQTFTAAATLGDGWWCGYRIESGVTVTLDPNSTENIDAALTKAVTGPSSGVIWCNGAQFYTVGFGAGAASSSSKLTNGFRLSLATGTPVTTTDQTAKTTIYCTPYVGNEIALYSSGAWSVISSAEVSVSVPATTNTPFDVFAYNNAGNLALETVNWTNDTTRATGLTTQDGVLVKSGDATRRFLGTGRTTGSSGQTESSKVKRFLRNYYNRLDLQLLRQESAASWTSNTATIRQANANSANQVEWIEGWVEDPVVLRVQGAGVHASNGVNGGCGVGLDSTSAFAANSMWGNSGISNQYNPYPGSFNNFVSLGYHYAAWLEQGIAAGTMTWYGGSTVGSGISGEIKG